MAEGDKDHGGIPVTPAIGLAASISRSTSAPVGAPSSDRQRSIFVSAS